MKRVCDVGGGRKPVVGLSRIQELGLDYVILDESTAQLERVPPGYQLCHGSVLDDQVVNDLVQQSGPFDLVVSHFVAEHMPDGRRFHQQVFRMLRPGGSAVHLFPTLYALPYLVNRVLDSRTSAVLARRVINKGNKFPAYYSWCRGPSRRQVMRLEAIGYHIDQYVGLLGHSFYIGIRPLDVLHRALTARLLDHPRAWATSMAVLAVTRPA